MASYVEKFDATLSEALSGWTPITTLLSITLLFLLVYPLLAPDEPDTHPLLLARQSTASPIRQPGESAIYRSNQVPHGYPLRTGLNVKDSGANKWAAGRNGDLRDVWNKLVELQPAQGTSSSRRTAISTVLGKEEIIEHDMGDLCREINVIGKWIHRHGGHRVALYMPNSIEFLITVFAASYYGFSVILIPYNQRPETVIDLLKKTKADCLVAQAGSLPLGELTRNLGGLAQVIWVVESSSRHMDWSEVPDGIGGRVDVWVWHEVVQDHRAETSPELPGRDANLEPGNVITIWQEGQGKPSEIVEFTQSNLVSAISGLISALPADQRMSPADLFFPAEAFTHIYCLTLTFAAIFSRASIAINSVAGPGVNLKLACRNIAPTVIVASAETAAHMAQNATISVTGYLKRIAHYAQAQALASGRFPSDSILTRLGGPTSAAVGTTPGQLRLLFVSEKARGGTPPLSAANLSDLRIHCGCRVVYALTAAKVAGAVAQTDLYDYRREIAESPGRHSHFGPPLSSVEVKLVDTPTVQTTDEGNPKGEIVVMGPAVAGGEASIGAIGTFRDDHTLAYL